MKKTVSELMFIVLLASIMMLADIQPVRAAPKTWTVDDDGPADFHTIQEAINSPQVTVGDSIYVHHGTYYENVVVNKTVSLIGEDKDATIIDGNSTGNAVLLTVDNTIITRFTVHSGGSWNSGIRIGFRSRNNTVADCIVSDSFYCGIYLDTESYDNVIINNVVSNNYPYGIFTYYAYDNTIIDNELTFNDDGIYLYQSWNNSVTRNVFTNNSAGILLGKSQTRSNLVSKNNLTCNDVGISLQDVPQDNLIYHNNLFNNTAQVSVDYPSHSNVWDDGYPSGGNYWSDHITVDDHSGINQDELGSDGIVDDPYIIDDSNRDGFPIKDPISFFDAGTWSETTYYVDTISNSTISNFHFSEEDKKISFDVTGQDGTGGFCRITIPNALLGGPYVILVNGSAPLTINEQPSGTHNFIYFTYNHSTKQAEITGTTVISEFSSWISRLLVFIILVVAMVIYKRRLPKTRIH